MTVRRLGRLVALFASVVAALGLAAIVAWVVAIGWKPGAPYTFKGVDMSGVDGAVDWWAVKRSGADFVYLRATVDADRRDTRFEENWARIAETGMRRGALHHYSLCKSAVDQANNFNTTVPRTDDALPAAVDLSFTPDCTARPQTGVVLEGLRRYLDMVEAHTGKPVLVKVTRPFDTAYGVTAAIARPVWAVQNYFAPDYPARPWRMWQANAALHIEGVEKPVHWNVVRP